MDDAITVAVPGVTIVASASSQRVVVPEDASGNRARFCQITTTGAAHVLPGNSTVTATGDCLMVVADRPVILATKAFSTIAVIERQAGSVVNIVPLEF